MRFFYTLIALVSAILGQSAQPKSAEEEVQQVCPNLVLKGYSRIKFSETERLLLCGNPKSEAWKNVPRAQALFHLRTFLQDRGYYRTTSEDRPEAMVVHLGPLTKVTEVVVDGPGELFQLNKMRHIRGEVLTPSFLNDLKDRLLLRLRTQGYPCPEVDLRANPDTGVISVNSRPGPLQNIVSIVHEPVPHFNAQVLDRYNAFQLGKRFDADLLTLTSSRITNDGIYQSHHFIESCTKEGTVLKEKTVPGPPRQISVGFGANTEQIALTRITWRHLRLGQTGSDLEFRTTASLKEQEFATSANWYYLPFPSRHFLFPRLAIKHRNINSTEYLRADFSVAPAVSWDNQWLGARASVGPGVSVERTWRPELIDKYFSSLTASLDLTTHDFEFFRNSPQGGFQLSAKATFTRKGWFSDVDAQMIQITGQHLWNFLNLDPPLLIIGVRGGLATTFSDKSQGGITTLPSSLRQYLGGWLNVRGWGPSELAGPGADPEKRPGSLSSAFLSTEVRLTDVLPLDLQPFVFIDAGALGQESLQLQGPVFYSPGAGMRWESKFGIFQGMVAHGYMAGDRDPNLYPDNLSYWRFDLRYGEEF